jgi:peptidoglycan/LPS O-acetylase OafA/YrhL
MKLTYRPEIDGLRAIAVAAVILYHTQITIFGHQLFKGGFIGVDIFFVISGYLITSIILKELVTTGTFSFKHFYERRVRRILPVLLFIMLVSLPFAWMYLLPNSLIDLSKSILYSLGFGSNFYFHYSGQQYGAADGLLKPFLHTWSLSVEEQYYILFPIFLLIIFKYFRKYLIHILILSFVISLGLAEWTSKNYPSTSFYFFHTRAWELLAGSILAFFEITKDRRNQNKSLILILPFLGLILIGHSILFFNDRMFHPSYYTLSPIIGTCLIIQFSNKNELITKILSTKLFVGIGLISYSLYLWHYPVFAFARITETIQGSFFNKLLLGIIIVILSILSYYFIERPARNKNIKPYILFFLIFIIFLLIFLNYKVILKKGYISRIPLILQNNLEEFPQSVVLLKNYDNKPCYNRVEGCEFNILENKKVFLIGDSQMAILGYNLKDRIVAKNYKFIISSLGSCMFFPGFNLVNIKTYNISSTCNDDYFQKLYNRLKKEKNSILIFGGNLPSHLSGIEFNNENEKIVYKESILAYISNKKNIDMSSSFREALEVLSLNNKIIIIYPIPEVGYNVPEKIMNKIPKNIYELQKYFTEKEYISINYNFYKDRTYDSYQLLDSIKNKNIIRLYPHKLFCNTVIQDKCVTHDDKNIFYGNSIHPSLKGAEMINNLIIKEIEKIELQSN